MVQTRSQLENVSEEELIKELVSVEDLSSKISNLTSRFNGFLRRYEILSSELFVTKNCNNLLSETIVKLERNTVNNEEYHRESLEKSPILISISNEIFESNICKALSLTVHEGKPNDLQACHHLKK